MELANPFDGGHYDVLALNHHCQVDIAEEKLQVIPSRRLGAEPGWSDRERIDFLSLHCVRCQICPGI